MMTALLDMGKETELSTFHRSFKEVNKNNTHSSGLQNTCLRGQRQGEQGVKWHRGAVALV